MVIGRLVCMDRAFLVPCLLHVLLDLDRKIFGFIAVGFIADFAFSHVYRCVVLRALHRSMHVRFAEVMYGELHISSRFLTLILHPSRFQDSSNASLLSARLDSDVET